SPCTLDPACCPGKTAKSRSVSTDDRILIYKTAATVQVEQRTNQTHESKTDPDARLYKKGKGKEAKLCYAGHVVMENRNGLAVDGKITKATGTAEREAALDMLDDVAGNKRVTLGTDKAYDTHDFVEQARAMNVTPHVTQNTNGRTSAIDGRTTRHEGYRRSLS